MISVYSIIRNIAAQTIKIDEYQYAMDFDWI